MNRGTLQSLQQTTSTFAGIVKSFCKALNWDLLALIVSQFQDRIFFGVHQDLVDLMKISVLNGKRARALFNAGYQTLVDISKANVLSIEKCLIDSIGFDVHRRDGETNYAAEQRNKQLLLHVTGRAGLTATEAAQIIIDEARNIVRTEMGIGNIVWSEQTGIDDDDDDDKTKCILIEQQAQSTKKRKVPLDAAVVTPSKRRNHGQMSAHEESSTSDSGSENSDVDSIDLDTSTPFYNDENDDFMAKLQLSSSNTKNLPAMQNDQQNLAMQRCRIIDVAQNANEFNEFIKSFETVQECGFAIAIAPCERTESTKPYRCPITSEHYLCGISMCFQDKCTVHFLSLQDADGPVDFNKRIQFIQRNILTNPKLTLQMNDAKSQLNTLLMAIANVRNVNCHISDTQIAQWLIQPDDERTFSKLVWNWYNFKCKLL